MPRCPERELLESDLKQAVKRWTDMEDKATAAIGNADPDANEYLAHTYREEPGQVTGKKRLRASIAAYAIQKRITLIQMQRIRRQNTAAFLCDVCKAIFRIPLDEISGGSSYSVACPTCGRTAKARRSPDGALVVQHGDHVFVCPRPLEQNPVVALISYLGAIAFLAAIFCAIERIVNPMMCPVVLFCTLFAVGLVAVLQLASAGKLDVNLVKLMEIFYRTLPTILGMNARRGVVTRESTKATTAQNPQKKK